MKKEKKEKKEIKIFGDQVISLKTIVTSTKLISLALVTISIVYLIISTGYFIFSTKTIFTNNFEDILNDKITVNYISKINDYTSLSDIKDTIELYSGKVPFYILEIVIPTIILIVILLLCIVLGKKLYDFIKNVKTNKDLFTNNKIKELKKIRNIILEIIILLFLSFNITFLIIYVFLDFILEIIIYLFNVCVEKENK